ncbi:MAG TPA: secretin N-terminal domain-containing protein [Myxococcota bacterium]|jgi:type II secretory pathway component GspD/PulD (secretin)
MRAEARQACRRLALLTLALAVALPASGAPQAEVYRVQHRSAEELLPYAEAALGNEGRVVVDPGSNSLVLICERPALLRSALALLAAQDRALRTVVLEYQSQRESELETEGVRVAWGVATGAVRIGNLMVPAGASRLRVTAQAERGRSSSNRGGTVRILEGHSARIATGETRPLTTRRGWQENTTLVAADSGLEAHARVLGDGRVLLELRPFQASFQQDGRIETSEASTTLTLEPGQTVVIAGLSGEQGAASLDAFAGAGKQRTRDEQVLTITARIE